MEKEHEDTGSPQPLEPGSTSPETVTVTAEEFAALKDSVASVAEQNKGLIRDLQDERARRRTSVRADLKNFSDTLDLSAEDRKQIEEGLESEKVVDVIIGLTQKVIHHEWGKYQTHQGCVTDLMDRHSDMFDEKGRYLANSEKGKLWESIATQHPEYKNHPQGVRMAMEDLESQLTAAGKPAIAKGKAKVKAAAEEEEAEAEEEEGEETPPAKPHVGDGGRKPAPKGKQPVISGAEKRAQGRYKMTDKEWNDSKNNKVIEADV